MGRLPLESELKDESSVVVMSQSVPISAKKALDKLTNDLCSHAIEHGFRKPNKGDVLAKLITTCSKNFDIPGYFKK